MIDGLTVLAGLADRIGQTVRCWSWTRSAALPPCVSMLGKEKVEGPSDTAQPCATVRHEYNEIFDRTIRV